MKRSRRQFLKTATVGASTLATAVTLPTIFPRMQAERAIAQEIASPNERPVIASIGTSRYRAGTWGNPEVFDGQGAAVGKNAARFGDTIAVADLYRPFAEHFAESFGGRCEVFQDYRKVLDNPKIDAVTIGTPDHWHVKIAIDAMRAGKHVYCEKPLTLTIAEGDQICKVTRETGKVLQVGTQQRSDCGEVFLKAAAICRSGRLGKKLHALSSVGQPDSAGKTGDDRGPFPEQPVPDGLWSWDFWLGQTPVVPFCKERWNYDFRWWLAYSGGQVTDWGVHHTDIAAWALGVDDQMPVSIDGTGTFPGVVGGYDVASTFDLTAKYANGHEIRLFSGNNELILSGEKGRIRVNRGGLTGKPVEELTEKDNEELAVIMNELMHGKPAGDHMRNFFDCMVDATLPVANVYSHVNTLNVCHMANICLRTGRKLEWDAEKREFIGDAEANGMIAREQRKGFETT